MRACSFFLLWSLFFFLAYGAITVLPVYIQTPSLPDPTKFTIDENAFRSDASDCGAADEQLLRNEDWLNRLFDPDFLTETEIIQNAKTCNMVYNCLNKSSLLTEEQQVIRRWAKMYLIFTTGAFDPTGGATLYWIPPDKSQDPALIQLRKVGVGPPHGYIFLRIFKSRAAMPPEVRTAFQNEDVAGVTFQTRYIAILGSTDSAIVERLSKSETLPETISHELVHAYVHSLIGPNREVRLANWFDEGLAIYFSGSGTKHLSEYGGVSMETYPPQEYAQFDINFKYLESRLGHAQFTERIRTSIDRLNPALLYQTPDLSDYDTLARRARDWNDAQFKPVSPEWYTPLKYGAALVMGLLLTLGAFALFSRKETGSPEWQADHVPPEQSRPLHPQVEIKPSRSCEPAPQGHGISLSAAEWIDSEHVFATLGFPADYFWPMPRQLQILYGGAILRAHDDLQRGYPNQAIEDTTDLIDDVSLNIELVYTPLIAVARYLRGLAYERCGSCEHARLDYQAAIEKMPTYRLAIQALERIQEQLPS
jgi:hypothetical protein